MTTETFSGEGRPSNIPELSVSELSGAIKRTLEDSFGRVRVRGELSRVTIHSSGHMYSDLKDDRAVMNVICWRGTLSKLAIQPEEGLEVICTGKISSYPARSNYQMIIESMELAGEGALLKMLEQRKKALAAEGLFAPERKKNIPFLPTRIGVITSPTGAVIRDIMHRIRDRFPRPVMLWPVAVQGPQAAAQIAAAIDGFNAMQDTNPALVPDLIIVARGGGSLEDLMAFNEEIVVRAAARSAIPLISAVGHETDTTLIDYAADMRAPTPTGAAEMAVPRRADLIAAVTESDHRLINAANRLIRHRADRVESTGARLGDPARLLEVKTQMLDHAGHKMTSAFRHYLSGLQAKTASGGDRLRHPRTLITEARQALSFHERALVRAAPAVTRKAADRLAATSRVLESLSYESILKRGYAVTRNQDGKVLTGCHHIQAGELLTIEYHDGTIQALTRSGTEKPQKLPKKPPEKDQGKLF